MFKKKKKKKTKKKKTKGKIDVDVYFWREMSYFITLDGSNLNKKNRRKPAIQNDLVISVGAFVWATTFRCSPPVVGL